MKGLASVQGLVFLLVLAFCFQKSLD